MSNTERPARVPDQDKRLKEEISPARKGDRQPVERKRSFPDPHPVEGSGKDSRPDSGDDPPWDLPPTPHHDNMGGDNAKSLPSFTGYTYTAVQKAGNPDNYYYRLRIDTLQVSVRGKWKSEDAAFEMYNLRSSAETLKKLGHPRPWYACADGVELEVYPHGGKAGYHVLMRAPDLPELRAAPQMVSLPTFMLRFGARWCFEHPIEKTEAWIRSTLAAADFQIDEILLSEVHICCDVPTPFVEEDLSRMRGYGTRNGNFTGHYNDGRLATITNVGGSKSITYSIYDKRLEQKKKRGVFWGGVWESFSIPEDSPIWRAEGRFRAERLKEEHGLYRLSDLDDAALEVLWHDFTENYLLFVDHQDARTDRAGVDERWAAIAACGRHHAPRPVQFETDISQSHGVKTAAGHMFSEMCKASLDKTRATVARTVDQVFAQIDVSAKPRPRTTIKELAIAFCEMVENWDDSIQIDNEDLKKRLKIELARRIGLKKAECAVSIKTSDKGDNHV